MRSVSREAGFAWSRAGGRDSAGATGVVKSVGEDRPPGSVECSGTAESESELAESPADEDGTGSSWPRANGTTRKYVDGAPPLGLAQCSATTESVLAVSSDEEASDETGPPWSRASGTWSAAEMAAVAKSVVGARPPGIAKFGAVTAATAVDSTVDETVDQVWPLGIAKFSVGGDGT